MTQRRGFPPIEYALGPQKKSVGTLRLEKILEYMVNPKKYECVYSYENNNLRLHIHDKEYKDQTTYYLFEVINSADLTSLKIPDKFREYFHDAALKYSAQGHAMPFDVFTSKHKGYFEAFDYDLRKELEKCLHAASVKTKSEIDNMLALISPLHKYVIFNYTTAWDQIFLNSFLRGNTGVLDRFSHADLQVYMPFLLGSIFYLADVLLKYHPNVKLTHNAELKRDLYEVATTTGFRIITDIDKNSSLEQAIEKAMQANTNRFVFSENSFTSTSMEQIAFKHPDAPFKTIEEKTQKKTYIINYSISAKPIEKLAGLIDEKEVLLTPGPMEYQVLGESGQFVFLDAHEVNPLQAAKNDYYPLQHAVRYAFDHYLSREYGYDFILTAVDDEKQLNDTANLKKLSEKCNNAPLLIKHHNQIYIYGYSDVSVRESKVPQKEWRLTKLDYSRNKLNRILKKFSTKGFPHSFVNLTNNHRLPEFYRLNRWDCDAELQKEIEVRRCHVEYTGKDDDRYIDLPTAGKIVRIHRNNHGLAHAMRQARNVDDVFQLIQKNGLQDITQTAANILTDQRYYEILKIAAFFSSMGREHESSFFDDHAEYLKMRRRTADRFEKYINEIHYPLLTQSLHLTREKLSESEKNHLQRVTQLCALCVRRLGDPTFINELLNNRKQNIEDITVFHLLNTAHILDTPRCLAQSPYKQRLTQTLTTGKGAALQPNQTSENEVDKVWQLSCERIKKTGDCISALDKDNIVTGYSEQFAEASLNPTASEIMTDFLGVINRDLILLSEQKADPATLQITTFQTLQYYVENSENNDMQLAAFINDKHYCLMMESAMQYMTEHPLDTVNLKEKTQLACFNTLQIHVTSLLGSNKFETIEQLKQHLEKDNYSKMLLAGCHLTPDARYSLYVIFYTTCILNSDITVAIQYLKEHKIDVTTLPVLPRFFETAIKQKNMAALKYLCEEQKATVLPALCLPALDIENDDLRNEILRYLIERIPQENINNLVRPTIDLDPNNLLQTIIDCRAVIKKDIFLLLVDRGAHLSDKSSQHHLNPDYICRTFIQLASPSLKDAILDHLSLDDLYMVYLSGILKKDSLLLQRAMEDTRIDQTTLFIRAMKRRLTEEADVAALLPLLKNSRIDFNTRQSNGETLLHVFLSSISPKEPEDALFQVFNLFLDKIDLTLSTNRGATLLDYALEFPALAKPLLERNIPFHFNTINELVTTNSKLPIHPPRVLSILLNAYQDEYKPHSQMILNVFLNTYFYKDMVHYDLDRIFSLLKFVAASGQVDMLKKLLNLGLEKTYYDLKDEWTTSQKMEILSKAANDEILAALRFPSVDDKKLKDLLIDIEKLKLKDFDKYIVFKSDDEVSVKFMKLADMLNDHYAKLQTSIALQTASSVFFTTSSNAGLTIIGLKNLLFSLQKQSGMPFVSRSTEDKKPTPEFKPPLKGQP